MCSRPPVSAYDHWITVHRYGRHPAQVAELHLPEGPPARLAVLVHGGYWRAGYDRSLQQAVATDLTRRGWAVWNVDYRAVGSGPAGGGGWPQTFLDVADAIDLLADSGHDLPAERAVVIGHSAGGTLALWAAARYRLPAGAPGANPRIRPIAAVAQAAICDLADGAQHRLGAGAVEHLMIDGDYSLASPTALLPIGVPLYVTTTAQDSAVAPQQSVAFADAATAAGDQVTLDVVPGEGHFSHLDPSSHCWRLTLAWLDQL